MSATFEAEKNKKALAYTIAICGTLLLLAFLISWPILQPPVPIAQDLLEINLGNNEEGMGEIQPLIKGDKAPSQEVTPPTPSNESPKPAEAKEIKPDENAEVNAAPIAKTEKKILSPLIDDQVFVENLVQWADVVRQSFGQGATDEIISTRRLVHIAQAYKIFGDKMKAITLCVNRFDEETKTAFLDLYSKVDVTVESPANTSFNQVNVE